MEEQSMTDEQILYRWYVYAARQPGFLGEALRIQRLKAFLFQEQQRAMLGIKGELYDFLWLRLQAMRLPRGSSHLTEEDIVRIVSRVEADAGVAGAIHVGQLEALLQEGMV
jgi:hypothetical protein